MDWMFEWAWYHYAAVFGITAVCGYLWYKDRSAWSGTRFGICAAMLVLIVGLGLVESNTEQCVRKTQEMAAAVAAKNPDGVVANLADDFQLKQGDRVLADKAKVREYAGKAFDGSLGGTLQELVVDSFARTDSQPADGVALSFFFKPKGASIPPMFGYGRAVYKKDAQGQWRVAEVQVFKDAKLTQPFDVPGL